MAYVSQAMKKELAPGIKRVLKQYGMKGSIAVRDHSTLVVTLREGPIDFGTNARGFQVNHFWIERHYEGEAREFLVELLAAMRGENFYDNTDIMTDYFDVSHYTNIDVGRFSKPYICTAKEVA